MSSPYDLTNRLPEGFMKIHPTLQKDLIHVSDPELCAVYMMPDSDNPWVVLIPKRLKGDEQYIREPFELDEKDQQILTSESSYIAKAMNEKFSADKMNIAALGNMVPQLHIHVICRFEGDKAWPGPIWGKKAGTEQNKLTQIRKTLEQICLD